ncbi:zinc finger MYM-type protein 4 isoform X2 [Sitophilus oryzae]|uniref:Zinc finger MYM-type protein 4 isoform X2 n=1 Tax=Sitophilus oryzae TaxID=7048 RepID=A0A6J2X5Q9_SITOR|nr:zinc finger MYM-type protein 4 isoform X2 [Sitophilus oryzae]
MEVDSIDSTMDNSASIPNNAVANEPVNLNVGDTGENKDFDSYPDMVSSMDTEELKHSDVTPSNGESESLDRIPSDLAQAIEPMQNSTTETHLESNLNIIENQNNENLERDNELMEAESIEQPTPPSNNLMEPDMTNQPLDSTPNNNEDDKTKNNCIDVSINVSKPDTSSQLLDGANSESKGHNSIQEPLVENTTEEGMACTSNAILEPLAEITTGEDLECTGNALEEPLVKNSTEDGIDGTSNAIKTPLAENTTEEGIDCTSNAIQEPLAENNTKEGIDCISNAIQEPLAENITEEGIDCTSNATQEPLAENITEEGIDCTSNAKPLAEDTTKEGVDCTNNVNDGNGGTKENIEGNIHPIDAENTEKLPSTELVNEEATSEKISDAEINEKEVDVKTAEQEIEKPSEEEKVNDNDANISKPACSDKDVSVDRVPQAEEVLENCEDKSVSAESSKHTEQATKPSEPSEKETPKSNDTSSKLNNSLNEDLSVCDQIEFAQVNFDSNIQETEKVIEKGISKGNELDPIASTSDVLATLESSQGADEEITIIPDSEREITEAEKQAASSLPTLKDISDKSKQPDATDENTEFTESELKIYKYEKEDLKNCCECHLEKTAKYHFSNQEQQVTYICDDKCLNAFKGHINKKVTMVTDEGGGLRVKNFMEGPPEEPLSLAFVRKCASCSRITDDIETNLTWEIMDFCNELCLSKYQKMIGSKCASCVGDVKSTSLGKYCVRFGNDIRQFCTSSCLEQYKKGLKVCSYCQQDMSNGPDGFLAPVGEKGQFKDFCSKSCMEKYDIMTNDRPPNVPSGTICSVCKTEKNITIEFEHEGSPNYFCGEPCFVAFAFVNKTSPGKCAMCRRHFNKSILEKHTMYYDNVQYSFCSNSCENIYIIAHRKIVPCSWCKVKKYNFDMIKKYSKTAPVINMCSINCLSLYQVSLNAVSAKPTQCHYCQNSAHPAYHLTMSDATMRNFCSYACVMNFQNQYPKQITLNNLTDPIPAGVPQKTKKNSVTVENVSTVNESIPQLPVISSVHSLASTNGTSTPPLLPPGLTPIPSTRLTRSKTTTGCTIQQPAVQTVQNIELPVQVQIKQHYIVKEKPSVDQRNVAIMCAPRRVVRGTQATPTMVDVGIQTEKEEIKKILIPVPVPIYVPSPCHMFAAPVPFPVPFPLPIPIPIFIPTTRNSAAGIMKEIKKIQVKIPTDPYEAELLMMAEMVAEEKKEENTDSESDIDDTTADDGGNYSPEPVDATNTFGDDMLQMALKMATELDEPAVDLEGALTANTITAPQGGHPDGHPTEESVDDPQPMHPHHNMMERSPMRGRKRGMRGTPRGGQSKRGRRMSHQQVDMPMMQPVQAAAPPEPQEKPDANMCLKYTFGVNAWKQWVTTKNAELEKSSRLVKLFKTEILQLTSDELNYSLCLFVKEVRKPNGQEYAPDTIYYLCLGIQQYLFENGRIDNIFCDVYYEKFTDCLDEVAKKFSVLYNDSQYIVTRVEEEHLWESKQLGAHSPHVLLSTLMFFNTKHFNLTSVDEHMQLSFSHIMKHWKRNPNQPGASKVPGSRNVLLRFYPPQSAIQNNQRKKKVYEQQENEENPLRCPVKLYEFYLSKCPESVKTRNDVFYLQPERSCVPDSPVWYSTMPLPKEALEKMLHRVKMVKEINVALLTS